MDPFMPSIFYFCTIVATRFVFSCKNTGTAKPRGNKPPSPPPPPRLPHPNVFNIMKAFWKKFSLAHRLRVTKQSPVLAPLPISKNRAATQSAIITLLAQNRTFCLHRHQRGMSPNFFFRDIL